VEFLVHQSKNNDTEHLLNHEVHSINTADDNSFVVTTSAGIYTAKKVIIAT
jgi:thioredoxin reductase